MYPAVKGVKVLDDYELFLEFENGDKRIFDVKPYLNIGKFAELKKPEIFKSVRVRFDTVEWSNQLDLDPELLYEKSRKAEPTRA